MKISELVAGAEVHGWMRLGLPLVLGVDHKGQGFRYVAWKPTSPRSCDLTKFAGLVFANNPEEQVLSLNVQAMDRMGRCVTGEALPAYIPYKSLQILHILSPYHFPAKPHNSIHPTNVQSQYVPYRTKTKVDLF